MALPGNPKETITKPLIYTEKALNIFTNTFGQNHPNVAIEYNNLGEAWKFKGEYDKAIDFYQKALNIFTNTFGQNHPNVAIEYNNLGEAWKFKGEYDQSH